MSAVPDEVMKYVAAEKDDDPQETGEWLEALDGVISAVGPDRAHYLIEKQIEFARVHGEHLPFSANTPYINTIPVSRQVPIPGDQDLEHRIRSYTRWNAIAMVLRAGKDTNVGGHIASFASAATLYDVGYNHFWHAPSDKHGGDLVFVQGHSSPGVYSRAFLLGRLTEGQLDNFRQEVGGEGISSYPHPWLMPDFWQFPTVSMGLGPIMAIYQARFMKYLQARGIVKTEGRKVWAFLGDGETDEPESLGAIGMAGRERLDNLVFVINCNLQRLDGPVRGNGKIIQELESEFRGAGWNVIKVVWGSRWDALFQRDKSGALMRRMMEVVDGEYQTYKSESGAFVREHFFNTPEDLRRVHRSDELEGPADRHPREDDQGLRHGRSRSGDEHHPPAEEAARGSAEEIPRSVPLADLRRRTRQRAVPQVRRRFEGTRVHACPPSGLGWLSAGAPPESRVAAGAGAGRVRAAAEGHG
jgi:pyruvate dehydrogenase E1 component